MRKSKKQQFVQAMLKAEVTVRVLETETGYEAVATIKCPGCGYTYNLATKPPLCLGCDFVWSGTETVTKERDLTHLRTDKVGRYVQV